MASTTKITVSINGSSTDYRLPAGVRTATHLAANTQFRQDFDLGSNITVLVNEIETDRTILPGDRISVRVNAARKAAAARIRVRVNVNGNTEDYFLPVGVRTAAELANSSQFKEDFGLSSSITVNVNGVANPSGSLASNDVITVTAVAARKA